MRIRVWYLLACSLVGSFFSTSARTQEIAITHARLLDGTGGPVVEDATILVEGKLIKAVGRTDVKISAGATVIDAKGKTAMPGLADMHVHLEGGWDGESVDLLGYQNNLNSLLYAGVTTVLDTGNIEPFVLQLRQAIASGMVQGPRIYCVGPILDGPDPIWYGATTVVSRQQVPIVIGHLKNQKVDLVKLYGGLSDQLVRALSEEARKNSLRTIIDQGFERHGSMDLMDEGIAGFAHLLAPPLSNDAIQHAKEKGIFFITTFAVGEYLTHRRFRDLAFLEDPLIADVAPPSHLKGLREFAAKPKSAEEEQRFKFIEGLFAKSRANVKPLWDAGVPIIAGTDSPYPGDFYGEGLHRELELLVESGLTPIQAVTTATKNAAAIMGAEKEWGTIETGKLANILLIDGKPDQNIHDTHRIVVLIKQGEIIDREKLKFSVASKDFMPVIETPASW